MGILSGIKMIITDLDGTLLKSRNEISLFTKEVFIKLKEKNIKTAIATGRSWCYSKVYADAIGAEGAVVHNGCVVMDNGEVIYRTGLDIDTMEKVLSRSLSEIPDIKIAIEIEDDMFANFDVTRYWPGRTYIYTDFKISPKQPAEKIVVALPSPESREIFEKIIPDGFYIEDVEEGVCIVLRKGATKENAIKVLASRYGINMEEIAVFGDYINDIGMLKSCGIGIAMENADPALKNVADYICKSNENDGVADFINTDLNLI
ncbi:MAG TPA: HAD family hydrolase [Firmicutes bacterium]|nr:HAD family hydrolase [Bacillota bacterium]